MKRMSILFGKELQKRPSEQLNPPIIVVNRQPNRCTIVPPTGPKRNVKHMAKEPTKAENIG